MDIEKAQDLAERAFWTAAQAAVALVIVELGEVPVWWAAPLAMTLSAAKTWIVQRLAAKADG